MGPTLLRRLLSLVLTAVLAAAMLWLALPAGAYVDPAEPLRADGQTAELERANYASVLQTARRHLGTNPTRQRRLWCADAMNLFLREAGLRGTGSRRARSFLRWGRAVPLAQARSGDVVVLSRGRRGGHVGVFVERNGNRVTLVSGNSGPHPRRVTESPYPVSRVIGVRRPH